MSIWNECNGTKCMVLLRCGIEEADKIYNALGLKRNFLQWVILVMMMSKWVVGLIKKSIRDADG